MRGPVGQRHPHTGHRMTAQRTLRQRVPAAGLDRADELPRDPAADHRRTEREAGLAVRSVQRLDVQHHMGELPGAAVLLDVPVHQTRRPADHGLPVRHLRAADRDLQTPVAAQLLHRHLQVQLAQARQQGLAGLRIGPHHQRRILLRQPGQRRGQPVGVLAEAGLDGHRDDRVGRGGRFQHEWRRGGAQGRTGTRRLRTDHGDDVPRHGQVRLGVPIGLHAQDPADPLGAPGTHVQHRVPLSQHTRVDPQIRHPAGRRRVHLEGQRGQRRRGIGGTLLLRAVDRAAHGRDVRR